MKRAVGFMLLVVAQATGAAPLVDEMASGAIDDSKIINRSMREGVQLGTIQAAFDKSDPRENIRRFKFEPTTTYKLRLREFMQTTIVLPEGEWVDAHQLGDSVNFGVLVLGSKGDALANKIQIRNENPGADTNLTIIGGSGAIYSFYLRVDSVSSPYVPVLVAYIEDPDGHVKAKREAAAKVGPDGADQAGDAAPRKDGEYLRELPKVDPAKLNYRYKNLGGENDIKPMRVFDDGYWTYFQFSTAMLDDVKRLPAIYRVVDGYDTPTNTRIVNGMVVAETLGKGWTLRSGESHYCIKREGD